MENAALFASPNAGAGCRYGFLPIGKNAVHPDGYKTAQRRSERIGPLRIGH
jgi:hypothetical protein